MLNIEINLFSFIDLNIVGLSLICYQTFFEFLNMDLTFIILTVCLNVVYAKIRKLIYPDLI